MAWKTNMTAKYMMYQKQQFHYRSSSNGFKRYKNLCIVMKENNEDFHK